MIVSSRIKTVTPPKPFVVNRRSLSAGGSDQIMRRIQTVYPYVSTRHIFLEWKIMQHSVLRGVVDAFFVAALRLARVCATVQCNVAIFASRLPTRFRESTTTTLSSSMSGNPPPKKRRVGPSDSSSKIYLAVRDPSPATLPSLNASRVDSRDDSAFDPAMISAIIGEQLSSEALNNLKDVSGGNTERGETSLSRHAMSFALLTGN